MIATLTGNGIEQPMASAFDGERVLIADRDDTLCLWKAANLSPIGFYTLSVGSIPFDACSDGVNFWITLGGIGKVGRF